VQRLARLALVVVIFAAAWGVYSKHRPPAPRPKADTAAQSVESQPDTSDSTVAPQSLDSQAETPESQPVRFRCDGRTYCSQMTSCAEAKYFLAHCPNVKMDGDHDGIPCERQWCPNG